MKTQLACLAAATLLAGCGGGTEAADDSDAQALAAGSAPGGLYVGYYAESPATNPEDPVTGSLFLSLPKGNAAFSGSMYFTYYGCQGSNVGKISGTKSGRSLEGHWAGEVDDRAESGPYVGRYSSSTGSYSGTYQVDAGKQFRRLDCGSYWIAPNGSWELFPVNTSAPKSFRLAVRGSKVSWTSPPRSAELLTSVIDAALAKRGSSKAVRVQYLSFRPGKQALDLKQVPGLVAGRDYVVTATAMDSRGKRLAFGSVTVER